MTKVLFKSKQPLLKMWAPMDFNGSFQTSGTRLYIELLMKTLVLIFFFSPEQATRPGIRVDGKDCNIFHFLLKFIVHKRLQYQLVFFRI